MSATFEYQSVSIDAGMEKRTQTRGVAQVNKKETGVRGEECYQKQSTQ